MIEEERKERENLFSPSFVLSLESLYRHCYRKSIVLEVEVR